MHSLVLNRKEKDMASSFEIKKILEDIVFHTYNEKVPEDVLTRMTKFYVKLENKIVNSYHGYYRYTDSSITIVNLNRNQTNIICTTIHELAHHVDRVFRGKTDHSKEFYEVFTDLLYTGLNMGLFDKIEALDMQTDASDSNKIKKILDAYVPNPIAYKQNEKRIVVRNCYSVKDTLKEGGFSYNGLSNSWEKVVATDDVPKYEEILKTLPCEYDIVDAGAMNIEANGTLIATDGSYEHREELKASGFVYNGQKKRWQKKINMADYETEMNALRHLNGKVTIKLAKK